MKFESHYLSFDNLRIVPREVSEVDSRSMVDTSTELTGFKMNVPVILPGMHSLYGPEIVHHVSSAGGLVVHPRDGNLGTYYFHGNMPEIYNVSLENALTTAHKIAENPNAALAIELNNGYLKKLHDGIREIVRIYPKMKIWAGAVCNLEGCQMLAGAGAQAVIVGNGVGSVCETTPRTAVGLPPVPTLLECMNSPIPIILAGGIKKYGDIVLSLILGADAVMIGGLLANGNDTPHKGTYWGEASRAQKSIDTGLAEKDVAYVEGGFLKLPLDNLSSYDKITEIKHSIQSACSFVGAFNIKELRAKAFLQEIR